MNLPEEKTVPLAELNHYIILLYGDPKIGKSTFCSQMEDPFFIATEAGLHALSVWQSSVTKWEEISEICAELGKANRFGTVVVDTIDNAYQLCLDYVCKKHKLDHPSDLEWGKGWGLVNQEFQRLVVKLSQMPRGLVMVSHAQHITLKTRTQEITKAVPTVPNSTRKFLVGLADIILYAEAADTENGTKRILRCTPSEYWEGGDRTGRLPDVMPLDYNAVKDAFKQGGK